MTSTRPWGLGEEGRAEEGGKGGGRGRGGGLQKESTPLRGSAWLGREAARLRRMAEVPSGWMGGALGPGLEVDGGLRDTEGGEGSSLQENRGHSQVTRFVCGAERGIHW